MITFLIIKVEKIILWLNFIFIWPCLITVYNLLIIANVDKLILNDIDETEAKKFSFLGLQKLTTNKTLYFYLIHLTIIIFSIYSKILTKYFSNTQYKIEIIKKSNTNLAENLLINKTNEEFKFKDLIIKLFVVNIDKITVIFMYLVAIKEVNLIHFSK